jgi:hypothetical protein
MKHSSTWFASILIASALLLNVGRNVSAASDQTRPNKHQKSAHEEAQTAKPLQPEPSVPLRDFEAAQTAALDALSALHAEQEVRAKEQHASYEPIYAPSVLIQFALLVVGVFYTLYAKRQWASIQEQARIANESLTQNRIAANAAKTAAEAAKLQAEAAMKTFQIAVRAKINVHPTVALESEEDQTLLVFFEVFNQGQTAAKVNFQCFNFFYKFKPWTYTPIFPDTPQNTPSPVPETFQAHDRISGRIETVKLDGLIADGPTREWDLYIAGEMLVCFCAHIAFFDEGGLFHETFLCETWDRTARRFLVDPATPRGWNQGT